MTFTDSITSLHSLTVFETEEGFMGDFNKDIYKRLCMHIKILTKLHQIMEN